MQLPDFLEPYRAKASKLLDKVGHVEFSGATYQVQVLDPKLKEEAWAILQLEPSGVYKDGFCSCEETEDVSRCVHLATAYLRIFNDTPIPLHQRFERSLWNQLCHLFADKFGYDPETLGDIKQFSVKAKNKKAKEYLHDILHERKDETEETSLKFSNLSQEELRLWREGRPSAELQYDLSFWYDFAKWMMLLQEKEKPKVEFDYNSTGVPKTIIIEFSEVEFHFKIEMEDLQQIIPSLATVESPLKVHDIQEDAIESMAYDSDERIIRVKIKTKKLEPKKGAISIGTWIYIPKEGFYAQQAHGILSQGELRSKDIATALDKYEDVLRHKLTGTKIYSEQHHFQYLLHFDDEWNLHIETFLFTLGDLNNERTAFYNDWVYVDGKGFYRTEGLRFNEPHFIVQKNQVGVFITHYRPWFDNRPGFQTHLASLEGQLTYTVSEDNHLSFAGHFQDATKIVRSRDFGAWVYIEGQGFYSKVGSVSGLPLRPGIALDRDQVPPFIRMNRDELKYVPGFFSEECPIDQTGLIIRLTDDERIYLQPHYELFPAYRNKDIRLFEDFTYVPGEGFHQLPAAKQLPEPFQEATSLREEEIPPFLSQELPRLKERYTVDVDPRLHVPDKLELGLSGVIPKDRGWYALKLFYKSERGSIPIIEIWDAMQSKKRFLYKDAGLLDLHHNRFDWLRKLAKKQFDRRSGSISLSTLDIIRLNIFDPFHIDTKKKKDAEEAQQFLEDLTNFNVPELPNLAGLASQLRPYQEVGLHWLWFLYHQNLSGLLCDDMGLGKTHQAMALLTAIKNSYYKPGMRFLVICPTSVIYHWEDKLAEHLPGMKVCTFYGPDRKITDDCDILLTSYGIWRLEAKALQKLSFEVAILDEVQMAKNENSRLHHSLIDLDAKMRIGLTGTPIENYLRELKALFDIVLPNYMPGPTEYQEVFVKPIERERDPVRTQLLHRFISPFVLRRKKEEVLTDLPEKTEEVYHCGLSAEQEKLYREVLERSRTQLLQEMGDNKGPIPYIHIFAILSSLKQICDHPAVYLKRPDFYKEHRSGKWDLFVELLSEARESKQKVVVYSQYLGMLDIIEEYLNEHGIGYASIRGSTTKRGDQVRRFNQDPVCEVFVGSLQASGLGIDLTAASVVIHYDRWWNAARENQATDRVHRIGQQRGVQVFKLVTKGTFEERIDQLITSKGELMESVVGTDDQHVIKYLTKEEVLALLEFTGSAEL